MSTRFTLLTVLLMLSAVAAEGQEPRTATPEVEFQEAWFHEMAEGRFEDALDVYRAIAARVELPDAQRARALFRAGVCLRKLQRKDESLRMFRRVVDEFPNVPAVVSAAQREIEGETEAEAAFRLKVESLIERLGREKATRMVPTSRGSRRVDNPVIVALREVGPRAAPFLLTALGSGDYFTCQNAALLLVEFAETDPSTRPAIIGALRSGDEIVRGSLIAALKASAGDPWTRILVDLLDDREPRLRLEMVRILGGHASRLGFYRDWSKAREHPLWSRLAAGLSGSLDDTSVEVRTEALRILGDMRASEHIDALERAFADPEERVRLAALEAVRSAQRFSAGLPADYDHDHAPLLALLDDQSPDVVATAVGVLDEQQARVARDAGDDGMSILPAGESGRAAVLRLAAIARGEEAPDEVRVAAARLIATRRPAELPLLVEAARSNDSHVVKVAVEALGRIGDRSVVPVFLDVLTRSEDQKVRSTIWSYVARTWRTPGTVKSLIDRLPQLRGYAHLVITELIDPSKRRDLALAALVHFDAVDAEARRRMLDMASLMASRSGSFAEGLEVVLKGLKDDNPQVLNAATNAAVVFRDSRLVPGLIEALGASESVQSSAIYALGRLGDRRAVPALLEMLESTSEQIANRAATALIALSDRSILSRLLELLRQDAETPHPRYALAVLKDGATAGEASQIADALANMIPGFRVDVLELLGELESPAAVPNVRRQLGAEDKRIREAAITTLASIGGADVLPDLVRSLGDQDSGVRRIAAEHLPRFEPGEILAHAGVVDDLIACLEDRDWSTRVAAVDALAHLRDPTSVPALVEALREGDSRPAPRPEGRRGRTMSRARTASRLRTASRVRAPSPPRTASSSSDDRMRSIAYKATGALLEFGDHRVVEPMIEVLEQKIRKNPWLESSYALDLLERHARPQDAPLLAASLARQEPRSRKTTLWILGGLLAQPVAALRAEVVPTLLEFLADEEPAVRAAAVGALGRLNTDEALAGVTRALDDSSERVRVAAVETLGHSTHPRALSALLTAFAKETSRDVLKRFIEELETFGDPAAIPELLNNVRDGTHAVYASRKRDSERPAEFFYYRAIGSLRHYPAADARKALLTVLDDPDDEFPLEAKEDALVVLSRTRPSGALSIVSHFATSAEEASLRTFATSLLGSFLDESALPHLIDLLKDPDPRIRGAAKRSIDEIRYYLQQKDSSRRSEAGERALGEILKLLDHKEPAVRLAAVKALAALEAPASLAPLVRLRKDPDPEVRRAVEAALDKLVGP